MKKSNIPLMILLFVVTLGIYGIYWIIDFQIQLNKKTKEGFGWLGHVLMLFLTFGVYFIYWQYAAGRRLASQGAKDRSLVYLFFCFIYLFWLNPFLMQAQANKLNR